MKERIAVGDIVNVKFHSSNSLLTARATVIHIPVATGDSWIFRGHGEKWNDSLCFRTLHSYLIGI